MSALSGDADGFVKISENLSMLWTYIDKIDSELFEFDFEYKGSPEQDLKTFLNKIKAGERFDSALPSIVNRLAIHYMLQCENLDSDLAYRAMREAKDENLDRHTAWRRAFISAGFDPRNLQFASQTESALTMSEADMIGYLTSYFFTQK